MIDKWVATFYLAFFAQLSSVWFLVELSDIQKISKFRFQIVFVWCCICAFQRFDRCSIPHLQNCGFLVMMVPWPEEINKLMKSSSLGLALLPFPLCHETTTHWVWQLPFASNLLISFWSMIFTLTLITNTLSSEDFLVTLSLQSIVKTK